MAFKIYTKTGDKGQTSLTRGFIQLKHNFSEKFYANVGFTYQYLLLNGSQSPEPRLGLKYEFNKKQLKN